MMDWKNGQLVSLKSGSPIMTIDYTYYSYRAMVVCVWHENGVMHKKAFAEHLLEPIELEEEDLEKGEDID